MMADYLHENPKDHGVIRPVAYWRKKISVLTPFTDVDQGRCLQLGELMDCQ